MIEFKIYMNYGYRCCFNTKRVNFGLAARYDGSIFEYNKGGYKFSPSYIQTNLCYIFVEDCI